MDQSLAAVMQSVSSFLSRLPPAVQAKAEINRADGARENVLHLNARQEFATLVVSTGTGLILIGVTIFERFGINVGTYSADFGLLTEYALLSFGLIIGIFRIDTVRFVMYSSVASLSVISFLLNKDSSSVNSLALINTIYFPFIFVLSDHIHGKIIWQKFIKIFCNVLIFCAISGILQFFLQFFIHDAWLFNFTENLPEIIQNDSGYNTVIPIGNYFKSNGFFLREPSGFSQLMSYSLIIELLYLKRYIRVPIVVLALVLSYSGTGIITFLIGMFFVSNKKLFIWIVLLMVIAAAASIGAGDPLNLSFTLGRTEEFSQQNSSGYLRFVAPIGATLDMLATDVWTPAFGHGPGTIAQAFGDKSFDPTWAKLIFEYGVFGTIAFLALIVHAIWKSPAPLGFRAALFVSWLVMGESLLSSEEGALVFATTALWCHAGGGAPVGSLAPTACKSSGKVSRHNRTSRVRHESRQGKS